MKANLVEIFSSIQGEGPYIGVRQVFLRLSGCNLECAYCDTGYDDSSSFRVELCPGSGSFTYFPNPVEPEEVINIISNYGLNKHHSISLTGGEPLLQANFVRSLGKLLCKRGILFFLETNGTLPGELSEIISLIDIISMDIKLPSATGGREQWAVHSDFLKIGAQKDIYVKAVVTCDTTDAEIIRASQIIREVNPKIPLILQPVHPNARFPVNSISPSRLMVLQTMALDYIDDVRVIPQTHKILGQL